MKAFIICSFKLAEQYKNIRKELLAQGHTLTYDWLEETGGRKRENGSIEQREFLLKERQGIEVADFVLLIMPCGNDSFVELGSALILCKPVYVVGKEKDYNESGYLSSDPHIITIRIPDEIDDYSFITRFINFNTVYDPWYPPVGTGRLNVSMDKSGKLDI